MGTTKIKFCKIPQVLENEVHIPGKHKVREIQNP
jgi:hypothetical protein